MVGLPRIAPMLATPGALPPAVTEERWAFEVKQDGQRAMVYLPGDGTVLLRSRSGADITAVYPEFAALGSVLSRPAVLDGEIVALDDEGRSDFERLQSRMGLASAAKAARMTEVVPVHLVLFDAVYLDGDSLTGLPYTERRILLEGLELDGKHWSTPAAVVGHGAQALEMTRTAGLEGVVAKRLASVYEPGARSRSWIKIRHVRTIDVIVGGWVPGRGRLTGLPGALLVGEAREGGLRYVGSVGTGWSDTERTTLANLLHVAAIDECPFDNAPRVAGARWVLPRLVGEIRYATRTRAGLLRHPSWHRLRPDLAPDDIT
ncbi:non-homologous end-joining DNA ligase (plasmid) [Streptomyces sp. NBC_00053]|uniref:non-homologous end-joining DNA ligase n=1 Tax=unclassified Streptomyces TaxID=2593676 RepID=UPI002253FFB9|nr:MULTISPECIES: non-homologous end-joining DNA ligase [unclassified Streptomyces]MCX4399519.1 non-homologous end-joining DNA ligase [Streptomyces sp. NBC_01767]MCX4400068.1 non-homologous end-joining DNA ligase [Streptomyces sp. NBC_01767]MCX5106779.1 non-homologous end-joining DNA ligase [Streptomyces sp. NBC_00439]MCX5506137.1 non-homologous end-joining DNA ligase [Streptomyces sp. NBC_00052]MCX5554160.1 non-homologous end-joining DNA ligase [Streptomyces sp. NBC_00051]